MKAGKGSPLTFWLRLRDDSIRLIGLGVVADVLVDDALLNRRVSLTVCALARSRRHERRTSLYSSSCNVFLGDSALKHLKADQWLIERDLMPT